jgi:hypothetical protein
MDGYELSLDCTEIRVTRQNRVNYVNSDFYPDEN